MKRTKTLAPILLLALAPLGIGSTLAPLYLRGVALTDAKAPTAKAVTVKETHEGLHVNAPESALPGEEVDVHLQYDATLLRVEDVLANTIHLGQTAEKDYFFVMPDEEVAIEVLVTSLKEEKTYAVTLENAEEEGVRLAGLLEGYHAGEEVSLSVGFRGDSPYTFTDSVEVYTLEGEAKEAVTSTLDGIAFRFTMPGKDVHVKVGTEKRGYLLTRESDPNIFSVNYGSAAIQSEAPAYIPYGEEIVVSLRDTEGALAKGLYIVETGETLPFTDETNKQVSFQMPAKNIHIKAATEKNLKDVSLVGSEHIALAAGTYADGVFTPAESLRFGVGETVAIQATPSSADYGVNSLAVSGTLANKVAENLYTFTMPNGNVTVTVTEIAKLYPGKAFLGTYQGFNVYGSRTPNEISSTYAFSIDEFGKAKIRSYDYTMTTYEEETGYAVFKGRSDSRYGYLGDNVFITSYTAGKDLKTTSVADFIVSFKVGSSASGITAEGRLLGDSGYMIAAYWKEGTFVDAAFVNIKKLEYHVRGVTLAFEEGSTSLLASDSAYTVKIDGVASYKVSGGSTVTAL